MFKLTRKGLWAHKVRFALTGLAVVLGVAFMAGTMILTDTMGRTFNGLFETANSGIDVVVQRESAIDETNGADVQEPVDAALVAEIGAVDGVASVAGTIAGFAQYVHADGTTGTLNGIGATVGSNWVDGTLNAFSLADGHAPGAGEVVLDKATIDREGWSLGHTVTVIGKTGPVEMRLVGSATFGDIDGIPGSTLVAVDDPTAQSMFGTVGAYDAIAVASDGTKTNDELATAISTTLGDDHLQVTTGDADTADKQADFKDDVSFFNTFLMTFAYIALFVGMFIIYNTFSIIVAQRMKEMAMLRAIGAKRRQVLGAVLIESALVGIVASGIGLAMGVVMSYGLRAMLGVAGLDIPGGAPVIAGNTVVTTMVVGTAITVFSSIFPAIRASRIAPIAALRDVAIDRTGASVKRAVIGVALLAGGAVTFAAGMVGDGAGAMKLVGVGAALTLIGVFVGGPVIAKPAMHALGGLLPLVSGTTGRLARENAKRNPRRTASTASALMIGVTLVGFITIVASSSKASIYATVDDQLRADYVVESGAWGEGGFSPSLEGELAALGEVETVVPFRSVPVVTDDGTAELDAFDTTVIEKAIELDLTSGSFADVHGDGIAVSSTYATDHDLALGDTLTVTFAATGPAELNVNAIYDRTFGNGESPFFVGLDTFEANVTDQYDRQIYVTTVDGVDAERSSAVLTAALEAWPNAELQDHAAFKESVTSEIDTILNLIYGLLGLAVIIALIGIANTLALSVHERTRELGLLRAVGMTRRQVRTAIRWESVLISLLGTALGFFIAVGAAWGMVTGQTAENVQLVIPAAQLATIVGLAAIAGVIAALGPARRAARLNVLTAIATA